MLGIDYANEEELNKDMFSGKIQRIIFDYIKEIYLNREIHLEMCTDEINRENVYYYFDAQIGDMDIEDNMIYSQGTNKYARTLHDLIGAVYEDFISERELWKLKDYKITTIDSRMGSQELYKTISDIATFEKVEEGYYLDYITKYGFDFKDARIIYGASHNAWLKDDSETSLGRIVSEVCVSINDKKVRLEEIKMMKKNNLLDAIFNQDFELYTTLHSKEEKDATLKDILNHSDTSIIYNVSENDAKEFIRLHETKKEKLPSILIVSENLAIDNSEGECFIEEFDCHEKALKWVGGSTISVQEVENIFSFYDPEQDSLEIELGI